MNSLIKRFLPPGLVVATAAYVGWPPPSPLDLGDDIATARSVRWRLIDLEEVTAQPILRDPLAPVLVAGGSTSVGMSPVDTDVPAGDPTQPTENDLRSRLHLTGLADINGQRWAIFADGPRTIGEHWLLNDFPDTPLELIAADSDSVIVRAGAVVSTLRVTATPESRLMSRSVPSNETPGETIIGEPQGHPPVQMPVMGNANGNRSNEVLESPSVPTPRVDDVLFQNGSASARLPKLSTIQDLTVFTA